MNEKTGFYSLEQLASLIEISIDDFSDQLDEYIEFKGLLYIENEKPFYTEGMFIISGTTKPVQQNTESEYSQVHEEFFDLEVLKSVTADQHCNDETLIGNQYKVKTPHYIKNILYSYAQFKEIALSMSLPIKEVEQKNNNKTLNYDVQQVNQKSFFTLKEAAYIAGNIDEKYALFSQPKLLEHTLEVLCDCVKGQNQSGFHLITKDLWTQHYCTLEQRYESTRCDIETELDSTTRLDLKRTLISKSEFLRWCKFMKIETGLTEDIVVENESVEALNFEIARLKKQLASPPSESVSDTTLVLSSDQYVGTENIIKIRTTPETLLVTIGVLVWMLAEKKPTYKKGNIPNSSKIQTVIKGALTDLKLIGPDNDNYNLIISNLGRDISLSLKHLNSIL